MHLLGRGANVLILSSAPEYCPTHVQGPSEQSALDGVEKLVHEVGVDWMRYVLPGLKHFVVGPLHQPLLQLHNLLYALVLLRLHMSAGSLVAMLKLRALGLQLDWPEFA